MPYMDFWNRHIPSLTKERQDELYKKYIFQEEHPKLFPKVKEAILYLYSKEVRMFIVSSDNPVTLLSEVKKSGFQHREILAMAKPDIMLDDVSQLKSIA